MLFACSDHFANSRHEAAAHMDKKLLPTELSSLQNCGLGKRFLGTITNIAIWELKSCIMWINQVFHDVCLVVSIGSDDIK
jgi:hypothetical protein